MNKSMKTVEYKCQIDRSNTTKFSVWYKPDTKLFRGRYRSGGYI